MEFEVLSRSNAKRLSYKPNIKDCIIISITDFGSNPNQFAENPHIKNVIKLQFDDVDFNDNNCITKTDGKKIIDFVNRYVNKVDKIIVHCEAGVSRSAGVCAALMHIINGDDSPIFNNPKFCPNMACYRTVMEAYYDFYNEEEAKSKIVRNIKLWKMANELDNHEVYE